MPQVHRQGDLCSGHGCFPPRPTTSWASSTYVNNLLVHRTGDSYATHCCGIPCHGGSGGRGSSNTIIENAACRRIGDPVSCGSIAAQGSPNVIVGG